MRSTRRSLIVPGLLRGSLVLLVALLSIGGGFVLDRTSVHAADLKVTGTLSQQPDGTVALSTDSNKYGVVTAIDLTAFLKRTVDLLGDVEGLTLYARQLTLGAVTVEDQAGTAVITTTATVEQAGDTFQATIEGIVFTLDGGDKSDLGQLVGQTAHIQGALAGFWISISSISP